MKALIEHLSDDLNAKKRYDDKLANTFLCMLERIDMLMCYIAKTDNFDGVWNEINTAFGDAEIYGFSDKDKTEKMKIISEVIDGYRAKASNG